MEEEATKKELQLLQELQLLPSQTSSSYHPPSSSNVPFWHSDTVGQLRSPVTQPSLDLKLSISVMAMQGGGTSDHHCLFGGPICEGKQETGSIETLKWQAAEEVRLAAMEKAYAERVRELTRREMDLAQTEFARARQMWQRAREEVEKAERMKERATRKMDSTCMEITCHSCRQRFKP